MTNLSEKDKSLASLALFSSLYDTHRNIRDVLIDFIKMSVMEHGQLILRPVEVKGYLKEDYGFDNIPLAIVEAAMLHASYLAKNPKEKGTFNVKSFNLAQDTENYKSQVESSKEEVDKLLKALREHLKEMNFSGADKISDTHLQRALGVFLIESSHNSELSTLIHQFVILHPDFVPILQRVSDGAIIFMGISYNSKGTEYTTIQEPLTLYIDTEILFYAAGYDGPTFEMIFKEFIDTVHTINNKYYEKKGRKLISLKYFPEIKEEIEGYFAIAEKIISGRAQLDPSRNAMSFLVRTAKSPSDLVRIKAKFWNFLRELGIKEEEFAEYYHEDNKSFNIESEEFVKQLSINGYIEEEDAKNNMAFLNYVNIRRKNRDQKKFANIGYLFVTQTRQAYQLANIVQRATSPDNFPLATSLSQITARLWLGLNQGFNPSATLRSMDVLVKAQIGLSAKIKACLEKKHKDLRKEHSSSSPEMIATEIAALRIYVPNSPEDLTMSTEVVHNVNNLEKYVDDKILEVQQKDEIIKTKDSAYAELQIKHRAVLEEKENENTHLRSIVYTQTKKNFKDLLKERSTKRMNFIRDANKHSFWSSFWPVILVLGSAIISVILFINDNTKAGYTILGLGALGIIIELIRSLSDIMEKVSNLLLPFSKRTREKNLRKQLKEFSTISPYPSWQDFFNSYLKNK